jgi:serine/threonine-protein kinase
MSSDDDLTLPSSPRPTRSVTPFVARGTPAAATGFTPGAIVAGRYRLVALLGRGGMGEVYRADDLTLDQTVALKFLPEGVAASPARLTQFHNELRVARQVSHKNVCRLYDLGEADGRPFLTMEYVDGEDLGALLRRIGRFPEDRALAIARQLCAGIAAAHERAVIHRDLKPANVMIDGEGNARITDFGIATATLDVARSKAAETGAEVVGTPQYMAPEQLTGHAASVRSDIYALGLILFEVFTGKRAYDAKSIGELKTLHDTGTITTPTSVVKDLDPAIERVILRCLDKDPARRPPSTQTVPAAQPGGDTLAAALAAAETPSPDVLAAAAESDAIPVRRGVMLAASLIASLIAYAFVSPRATMAALVPLDKAPAVLADRAGQILEEFGYADVPADTAHGFMIPPDFPRWLVQTDATSTRWSPSRTAIGPAVLYWCRTSPRDLEPDSPAPTVTPTDPALTVTGQTLVALDTRARLVEFRRVPPQLETPEVVPSSPPWPAVFRAAGLDEAGFTPVNPEWTPKDFADARAAWEGPSRDDPSVRLRIEAAAYRGRISSAYVIGPWSRPRAQQPIVPTPTDRFLRLADAALWWTVLAGAVLVARNNLRSNRADRRGAARLALLCLCLQTAAWLIGGHHRSSAAEEVNSFFRVFGNLLLQAGLVWVLYVAIEPYGRRFWPDGLLGWTRLFSGHLRDPRIGRDILIGSALGGLMIVNDMLRATAPYAFGRAPGIPGLGEAVRAFAGPGQLALIWADQTFSSIQTALIVTMLFVGMRLIVRRTWIAVAIGLGVLTIGVVQNVRPGDTLWLYVAFQAIAVAIITFAIFRFGLLVTALALIVDNIPTAVPLLTHGPSWATFPGHASVALVLALAAFGFYAARAGEPLFGDWGGA